MITSLLSSKRSSWRLGLILLVLTLLLAACGKGGNVAPSEPANAATPQGGKEEDDAGQSGAAQKLSVVTSFYPLYYLASEIGGEHAEVVNLIAAGVEPHDWTPKSRDLVTASQAQLLLYHGAGLETWMDDFLKGLSKDSAVSVKEMSYGIPLIVGEETEEAHGHGDAEQHEEDGHEHEGDDHHHDDEHPESEDGGHDDGHGHSHDHSHDTDPHTWVSPKSALVLAENVKNSLVEADPGHAESYEQNYERVRGQITALDAEYRDKLAQVAQKNIVVSHQAFGYLARDYGLNQIAIMGLSPNAEPRAQDILKIAKFVKEKNVKYIFFEELVSDRLAITLANEAKVDTMTLNPLEGLTKEQEKAGETYFSLMERNLQNLLQALQ